MLLPPPISTLFPYTTLFRSDGHCLTRHPLHEVFECIPVKDALNLGPGIAARALRVGELELLPRTLKDRKSTRLNSSHVSISYAVFCLKKKSIRERQQIFGQT